MNCSFTATGNLNKSNNKIQTLRNWWPMISTTNLHKKLLASKLLIDLIKSSTVMLQTQISILLRKLKSLIRICAWVENYNSVYTLSEIVASNGVRIFSQNVSVHFTTKMENCDANNLAHIVYAP